MSVVRFLSRELRLPFVNECSPIAKNGYLGGLFIVISLLNDVISARSVSKVIYFSFF